MKTTTKVQNQFNNQSLLENLKNVPGGMSKSLKNDLMTEGWNSVWNQFWGFERESFEKTSALEQSERKEFRKKANYEAKTEVILFTAQERAVAQEIEAIRQELIAFIKTAKEVDFEIEKTVKEIPVRPGVYHLRFLERIKRLLKLLREKLENSRTWLRVSVSKRKQRGYWFLYKKNGTNFGLSNERVVATQTG